MEPSNNDNYRMDSSNKIVDLNEMDDFKLNTKEDES